MNFLEFLERHDEFEGKTVAFITKWKDGHYVTGVKDI